MCVRVHCGVHLRTNSTLDMNLDGFVSVLCKSKCTGKNGLISSQWIEAYVKKVHRQLPRLRVTISGTFRVYTQTHVI